MTLDQIDHLRHWLERHPTYHLSIELVSNKIFLILKPAESKIDEAELFYVPLHDTGK